MDFVLKLLIIYIFFSFFILGFLLSKIKFNIKYFKFKKTSQKLERNFDINAGLYLYGFIKIISFNLEDDGIRIFGKKVNYKKINFFEVFKSLNFTNIEKDFKLIKLRKWKLRLDELDFTLDLGFENVLITSLSIFVVSTFLSFFVKKTVKRFNPKKHRYIIKPHYRDTNFINVDLKGKLSAETMDLINIILKTRKEKIKKSNNLPYKRTYEKSYE